MKLIALLFTLSSLVSMGSGTVLIAVHLPTHVLFVDEGPPQAGVTEVPCVSSSRDQFHRRLAILNSPYIPHHTYWNVPADTNLITLYGLKVSGAYDKSDPNNSKLDITIDCKNSVLPENYPFSVDEVVEKVKACVKLNFNPTKIIVLPKGEKEEIPK